LPIKHGRSAKYVAIRFVNHVIKAAEFCNLKKLIC